MDKKKKDEINKRKASSHAIPAYFEGGTQTDFSPMPPLTPVSITEENHVNPMELSLPNSPDKDRYDTPVIPFSKEVTKSDIKLEEFTMNETAEDEADDNVMFTDFDPSYEYQTNENIEEDVKVAV